jgi:hypothetical protein
MNIPVIDSNAVYTRTTLTQTLGLRDGTIPRELRLGRLRYSKRAGKIIILGSWVLEWISSGEIVKRRPELNGVARQAEGRS